MSLKNYALRYKIEDFAEDFADGEGSFCSSWSESNGSHWNFLCAQQDKHISLLIATTPSSNIESFQCTFILRDKSDKMKIVYEAGIATSKAVEGGEYIHCKADSLCSNSFLLDEENGILDDGVLCIDVIIQARSPKVKELQPKPSSSVHKDFLKLLESEEDADVTIEIGNDRIRAHKLILKVCSNMLADAIGRSAGGDTMLLLHIPTKRVSTEVFQHILKNIYADVIPCKDTIANLWKELLSASNYFGTDCLKKQVEKTAVFELFVINDSNVADLIMFAHTFQCSILKEAAIRYFISRGSDAMTFESVDELMKDLLLTKEIFSSVDKSETVKKSMKCSLNDIDIAFDWEIYQLLGGVQRELSFVFQN